MTTVVDNDSELITITEARARLRCSRTKLRRLASNGLLELVRLRGRRQIYVNERAVDRLRKDPQLMKNGYVTSPHIAAPQPARNRPLRVQEAAEYLSVTVSFLNKLRVYGGGPRFIKLGQQVRYDTDDLDRWVEARKCETTSKGK